MLRAPGDARSTTIAAMSSGSLTRCSGMLPCLAAGNVPWLFLSGEAAQKEEGANSGGLRIKLSIEHHRTMAWFGVSKRRSRCIIWSFILDVMGFLMPSQGL